MTFEFDHAFVFVVPGAGSRPKWNGDVSIRKIQVRYAAWNFADFGDQLGSDGMVALSHGDQSPSCKFH
ncbi:MAG: hypothetical protein AB1Z29_22185 [Desulfobacterales bacterium]|jgi:hypothetical protein